MTIVASPINWSEFSLEWLGTVSGEIVVSVMAVTNGKWLALLPDGGYLPHCYSFEAAKAAAEEWYAREVPA